MTINLTERERDLAFRSLRFLIERCDAQSRSSVPLECFALTWTRDELSLLALHFLPDEAST